MTLMVHAYIDYSSTVYLYAAYFLPADFVCLLRILRGTKSSA